MEPTEAARTIIRQLSRHPEIRETKRRELFIGHFSVLYPEYAWQISEYALGAEEPVRTQSRLGDRITTGKIDTRKGKLLIEYKSNLLSPEQTTDAIAELSRYVAGLCNSEGRDAVAKCLVTDILRWKEYEVAISSKAATGEIKPDQVGIRQLREYSFSEIDADQFVQTTKRLLFEYVPLLATGSTLLDHFGIGSKRYASFKNALGTTWNVQRGSAEALLGLKLWSEYLESCFDKDSKPDESNYLDHIYLIILARMIVGSALSSMLEQSAEDFPKRCLTGEIFESAEHRVEHFVEDDFFRWVKTESALKGMGPALAQLQNELQRYDFRSARKLSLFAELYEQIMPPKRRAELGEVLTPSWLVDLIVDSLPDCGKTGMKVLDPACGTGSFLRSVIARKLENLSSDMTPQQKLKSVLSDICGQDVNPVAVIISKATVMLTLSDLLKHSDEPMEIPIYLCDSLFLPKNVVKGNFGETISVDFDGASIDFPSRLFEKDTDPFESIVQRIDELARQLVRGSISRDDCIVALRSLGNGASESIGLDDREASQLLLASEKLFTEMFERIRNKRNSVWSFVLRNTYRPSLLKSNFDVIVSNPPWLAMSSLPAARYKQQLQQLALEYEILPTGASAHHFEIATIFALHCVRHYVKTQGKFAFVLPYVILKGAQHDPFRRSLFRKRSPLAIDHVWELEQVPKLFKRPGCVLFGESSWPRAGFPISLRSEVMIGDPGPKLLHQERILNLALLGNKSSFQEATPQPREDSYYWSHFRQGADLMPRRVVIVDIVGDNSARVLNIETSRTEVENHQNKAPFNKISLKGTIESDFVFVTIKSDFVLPFVASGYSYAALPLKKENGKYKLLTKGELALNRHTHALSWFESVDNALLGLQEKTLDSWLKRKNKLIDQSSESMSFLVLYGAGGTNICSAVVNTKTFRFPFVNDQTLYAWSAPDSYEAWYVCGMLNSDSINFQIKQHQPQGKFGEQHIHKLPLSLIPKFDPTNPHHIMVSDEASRISSLATKICERDLSYVDVSKSLSSRRLRFRRQINLELERTNHLAEQILRTGVSG